MSNQPLILNDPSVNGCSRPLAEKAHFAVKNRLSIRFKLKLSYILKTAAASVVLLSLLGCGSNGRTGSTALDGPAELMSVYKANCVNCHGTELQGKIGRATNLQKIGERMGAADIAGQIVQGGETMPPFKERLTEEQITGLAEWLAGKK